MMLIGGDETGQLLELAGRLDPESGRDVIFHAMPARSKFLP